MVALRLLIKIMRNVCLSHLSTLQRLIATLVMVNILHRPLSSSASITKLPSGQTVGQSQPQIEDLRRIWPLLLTLVVP